LTYVYKKGPNISIQELKESAMKLAREQNLQKVGVESWILEEGDKDFFDEFNI
jgi:hypothetical protein